MSETQFFVTNLSGHPCSFLLTILLMVHPYSELLILPILYIYQLSINPHLQIIVHLIIIMLTIIKMTLIIALLGWCEKCIYLEQSNHFLNQLQQIFLMRQSARKIIQFHQMYLDKIDPTQESRNKFQRFLQVLEARDLALSNLKQAIVFTGLNQTDVISICQAFSDNLLASQIINGQPIDVSNLNQPSVLQAEIFNKAEKQEISNVFTAKYIEGANEYSINVIALPDFTSSNSFYEMLSLGYFQQCIFSRIPKLKFVLVVRQQSIFVLEKWCQFKQTIFKFFDKFNSQKSWSKMRHDVFKATSLLIIKTTTSAQPDQFTKDLTNKFERILQMIEEEKKDFEEIIEELLDSKRIFFLEKNQLIDYQLKKVSLQTMYDQCFFQTPPIEHNEIDKKSSYHRQQKIMKKIGDISQVRFKEEFECYVKYTQQRKDSILLDHSASFSNIIKQLQIDAVKTNESFEFWIKMQQFNNQYYQFSQQYRKKRQDTEIKQLNLDENNQLIFDNQHLQQKINSPYFIKKFEVLEYLQQIGQTPRDIRCKRTIQELQEFSCLFRDIFRKLTILAIDKNKQKKILCNYHYVIQRLLQESKLFTIISFSSIVHNYLIGRYIREDIFRMIKDRILCIILGQINTSQLKRNFINKLDLSHISIPNQDIIHFLQSTQDKDELIELKITQFIIHYSQFILKERTPSNNQIKFAIKKLFEYRNIWYTNISMQKPFAQHSKLDLKKMMRIIFELTRNLAIALQTLFMFEEAIQCYRSLNDADNIFQIYQIMCKNKSQQKQRQRKLFIQYAKMAQSFSRKQLALRCLQKAYSISFDGDQLEQVADMIVKLTTDSKSQEEYCYLESMHDKKLYQDFSENLKSSLATYLSQ